MTERVDSALRAALASASEILSRQRLSLAALQQPLPKSSAYTESLRALTGVVEDCREAAPRILQLCLAEIAARQAVLDKAVTLTTTPEIAVNAFVHAMHRVRTSIDVALGCSEEIVEITSQDQVKRSAAESAAALRLIYHYTNELSDLSSLGAFMAHQENVPVDCGEILDSAAADLGYVANDAGVALERVSSGTPVVIAHTRPQLLKQTLSYIILNSITSPSVRRVSYDFHGGDEIVFVVKGDGCGTTLEERASAGTFSAMLGEASNYGGGSDASGFAVARRLAWALSGHIIFESTPGSGDTLMLNIPRLPSRPPLANR